MTCDLSLVDNLAVFTRDGVDVANNLAVIGQIETAFTSVDCAARPLDRTRIVNCRSNPPAGRYLNSGGPCN